MTDLMPNSRPLRVDTVQSGHTCSSVHCVYSDTIPKGLSAQWDHPRFLQWSHGLPQTSPLPDRSIINPNQYSIWETSRECHRSVGCYTFVTESYHITWSQIPPWKSFHLSSCPRSLHGNRSICRPVPDRSIRNRSICRPVPDCPVSGRSIPIGLTTVGSVCRSR